MCPVVLVDIVVFIVINSQSEYFKISQALGIACWQFLEVSPKKPDASPQGNISIQMAGSKFKCSPAKAGLGNWIILY